MSSKVVDSPMFKFVSSTRLFIPLFIIIIITLVLGTIILQNAPPKQYIAKYGERAYTVLRCLKLTDVYHAWWFITLLIFLAVNIFFCALKRFSLRLDKLGSTLVHFGIILILAGAATSAIGSERGFMGLREGETTDTFYMAQTPKKLGFTIKLKDFILERVHGKYIADYKSELTIIDNGKMVESKTIEVNDPLRYKGYTFYQANYNPHDLTWTGIQVVKDPGVPLVYAGFCVFIAGVLFVFYVKPFLSK